MPSQKLPCHDFLGKAAYWEEKEREMRALFTQAMQRLQEPENMEHLSAKELAGLLGPLLDKTIILEKLSKERRAAEQAGSLEAKPFSLPAHVVAASFLEVYDDIVNEFHTEYVLKGGRGSAKSSFVSLVLLELLLNHPDRHALITRTVRDSLRGSVYNQMLWAIDLLGLSDFFSATVSPLEITYLPTGQKIFFRGADDPGQLKSIRPAFGYIGLLWFEELDQFRGEEQLRSITQSVVRGGDTATIFMSFNPPKSARNWANLFWQTPKPSRFVHHSTYPDLGARASVWLGKAFLEEAEYIKDTQPSIFAHEYLGQPQNCGGLIFEHVTCRMISQEERAGFARFYYGLDWGWFPDPACFIICTYEPAKRRLLILDEIYVHKTANADLASLIIQKGITPHDRIIADSAEKKSIAELRALGLRIRGAKKGPGSIETSMKWLLSLQEIVIDPQTAPQAAQEFLQYEFEQTRDGQYVSGFPDKDNHAIDAVRYALEGFWGRR